MQYERDTLNNNIKIELTMGEIRKYICQDCGNTWERMEGVGMMSIIYHCDKCGNEKQIEPTSDYKEELMWWYL